MKAIAKVASARWGETDAAADAAGFGSFEQQADVVMSRARTQRAQLIVRAAVVVLLLLVLWACFAQVEEVTRGDGKVIPSKQLQIVQSLDGGVVSEILVQEGQVVEAGPASHCPAGANKKCRAAFS